MFLFKSLYGAPEGPTSHQRGPWARTKGRARSPPSSSCRPPPAQGGQLCHTPTQNQAIDHNAHNRDGIYFLPSFLFACSLGSCYPGVEEKKKIKLQGANGRVLAYDVKKVSSPSSSNSLEIKALLTYAHSYLSIIWWTLRFKYLLKTQMKNSTTWASCNCPFLFLACRRHSHLWRLIHKN